MAPTSVGDTEEFAVGAYGVRLTGIDEISDSLNPAPASWPGVGVAWRRRATVAPGHAFLSLTDHLAEYTISLSGTRRVNVRIRRDPMVAEFVADTEVDYPSLVHPYMTLVAAVAHWWGGRDSFHAGGFVIDGGAWAVLGEREAGKSTLTAHLASKGIGILTDDLVAMREGRVMAGVRSVDLREPAADWLGQGRCIGTAGQRERWRLPLAPVPAEVPLRGWVVPGWGESVEVSSVPPIERLPLLYGSLALTRPSRDPVRMLELAALPFLRFRRPRRWESLEESAAILLDRLQT